METYYTSDWHLGHKNIIRYSNRPFADVEEMNRAIIDNMKAKLKKGDRLYFVGDLSFQSIEKTTRLMQELKDATGALLYFVPGNHDPKDTHDILCSDGETPLWEHISPLMEVHDRKRKVILCHYAMKVWNKSHHGAYHLFGHSHGSMPGTTQSMDVGVDPCQFQPVTLDECIERMARFKPFRSEDHHKTRD
jgi:calcineurin-like phosphoesterase family protein